MGKCTSCQCMPSLMKAQIEVARKHLDEHMYLRKMENKEEAMATFIQDYGWIMREMYCTRICEKKEECEIADKLKIEGDLLKHHIKKFSE
jgi:hypothetical protein